MTYLLVMQKVAYNIRQIYVEFDVLNGENNWTEYKKH